MVADKGLAHRARRTLRRARRRLVRPTLTVVMACRDGGEFLEPAIRSVLNQDFRDLEIIVVDDGSVDGSRDVVARLAARDQRVRPATTAGGQGPGAARNHGVTQARGRFLAFVDADDLVLPGAYGEMVRTVQRSGSDMVVGGYRRHGSGGSHRPRLVEKVHTDAVRRGTIERNPAILDESVIWNRVFRTRFWRDAVGPFPEAGNYEDQEPALRSALKARMFDVLTRDVYSWRLPEGRLSRSQNKSSTKDLHDWTAVFNRMAAELGKAPPAVRDRVWSRWLGTNLTMFAGHVPVADDAFWESLVPLAARLVDGAADTTWSRIPVYDRLLAYVAAAGERADVLEILGTRAEDSAAVPVVLDGEVLRADLEVLGRLVTAIPSSLLVVDPALLELRAACERVARAKGGGIEVVASAYVPGIAPALLGSVSVTQVMPDGHGTPLVSTDRPSDAIDVAAGDPWRTYADAGFVATALPDPSGVLTLEVAREGAGHRWSSTLKVTGPRDADAARSGVASLESAPVRVTIDDVRLDAAAVVLHGRVTGQSSPFRIGLVTSARTFAAVATPDDDGQFVQALAPGGVAFPGDGYFVRWASAPDGELSQWAAPGPTFDLGAEERESTSQRLTARRHSASALSVTIGPPLTLRERSRYGQRVLRGAVTCPPVPAVLFETFNGKQCSGDPRAIFDELRRVGIDVPLYWSVKDFSIAVPDGGTPVVIGSADWHRALTTSRVLVNNNNFPHWFTKSPGQFYLQTWHGTPVKRLLWDLPANRSPLTYQRLMRRQVPMWDLLLAADAQAEANLRSGLGYTGDVWRVESPRNVALLNPAAGQSRVRQMLGLTPEDSPVILYAPTWREDQRTDARAHSWDRALNAAALAEELNATVLLRSHHVTRRAALSAPGVIDVSAHESIEDLMLASDVLVTDYSSVQHDWELLGRPAVIYAPDIEWYGGTERGFYNPGWPQHSPWPTTRTYGELAAAIRIVLADKPPPPRPNDSASSLHNLGHLISTALNGLTAPTKQDTEQQR